MHVHTYVRICYNSISVCTYVLSLKVDCTILPWQFWLLNCIQSYPSSKYEISLIVPLARYSGKV